MMCHVMPLLATKLSYQAPFEDLGWLVINPGIER